MWSQIKAIIDYFAADNETTHPKLYPNEWEDFLSVAKPGVTQDPDALLVGNAFTSASCRQCKGTQPKSQYCVDRAHPDEP